MKFNGSFGQWLKRRRKALDLTQVELADQVGCSVVTLKKIEADERRPSKQIVERLAEMLTISLEDRADFVAFARCKIENPPAFAHNVPSQPTPFVGRERELAQIAEQLTDPTCRLLTLVGPGGAGKTRLALQTAVEQAAKFAHGIYFVPLAPVGASDQIASAITNTLKLSFYGLEDPNTQVVGYLRDKHMLIVLDNFEHLLDGTGLLSDILANCPRVKLLVTSRERLNVQEEWVLLTGGLPFPDGKYTDPVDNYGAVQLFVQRARRVQPGFTLIDDTRAVIAICQAVEGMPLGLELAVSWLRVMPCDQIAAWIERDLDFLASPVRNVPERHRSLRAVFDHSWGLLSRAEQTILSKLSVFRGGFALEAAEQVAGASLLELASLVDKSLIRLNPAGRYDMHELLRQYAADKLSASGEAESISYYHFKFCLDLAEQSEAHLHSPYQETWLDRLEIEYGNLQAALSWALCSGRADLGLCLAGALGWFWHRRARLPHEGRSWMERALAVAGNTSPAARIKVLQRAADISFIQGDHKYSQMLAEEGLALARQTGDRWSIAWTLSSLGYILARQSRPDEGVPMLEEALALFREIGDQWGLHHALSRLGIALKNIQDERSVALLRECLMLARQAGARGSIGWTLNLWAQVLDGPKADHRQVMALCEESLSIFREVKDNFGVCGALVLLGKAAQTLGDYERAQGLYEEYLIMSREMRTRLRTAECLLGLGGLAGVLGKPERAVRLIGAAVAANEAIGGPHTFQNGAFQTDLVTLRAQLGETFFEAAWTQGQAMSLDQAIAYALSENQEGGR